MLVTVAACALSSAALAEDGVTIVTPPAEEGPAFDRERTDYLLDQATLEAEQVSDGVEAASRVPGVSLQRTNRGAGTPIIRGFVGPQNLIFIDDVRYNLSTFRTGPNQYAALSDPLGMDAVALTLGPGAVRYGSGAMGGVLRYRSAALREAQTRHGPPRGTLDRSQRVATHYDRDTPQIEAQLELSTQAASFSTI